MSSVRIEAVVTKEQTDTASVWNYAYAAPFGICSQRKEHWVICVSLGEPVETLVSKPVLARLMKVLENWMREPECSSQPSISAEIRGKVLLALVNGTVRLGEAMLPGAKF